MIKLSVLIGIVAVTRHIKTVQHRMQVINDPCGLKVQICIVRLTAHSTDIGHFGDDFTGRTTQLRAS